MLLASAFWLQEGHHAKVQAPILGTKVPGEHRTRSIGTAAAYVSRLVGCHCLGVSDSRSFSPNDALVQETEAEPLKTVDIGCKHAKFTRFGTRIEI
jgi:hypothetical protein